ncbi:amino acid permease [Erythrobacter mangrovi]|uniref:Amino acid permease n=1 Tax=Erythrobacter mangrovi TaxID=2739433 RepID=A0A7D4AU75_9SPHN|nr:amino acid permease [Erythrobacter mangrovi]QKG71737.1 amino acid permease [Erythrobacter mangrovi]
MSGSAAAPAKRIGLVMAILLVAGNLIGSGIYLLPATLAAIGSISLFGWIIATLGALVLGGVFSLIMIVRPSEDGLADTISAAMGPYWGFQSCLLYWLGCWLANIAIALAVTGYLTVFFPILDQPGWSAAATAGVIWLLTGIAILGPQAIGRMHALTMAFGLVPLLAAGTLGWMWFDPDLFAASWIVSGESPSGAVYGSLLSVFWAFVGVECAAMVARTVEHPERNVPLATMGGIGLAAIVYMLASSAIFGLVPAADLAASSAPFALAVEKILGPAAAGLVAICAILKASGTCGGWVFVTGETTLWSAAAGYLPRWLAVPDARGVPVRALLVMGVVMTIAVFATAAPSIGEQFETLINAVVVFTVLIYIYAAYALIRFTANSSPAIRVTAWIVAVLGAAFSALLIVSSGTMLITVTAALALATVPAWWFVKRSGVSSRAEPSRS